MIVPDVPAMEKLDASLRKFQKTLSGKWQTRLVLPVVECVISHTDTHATGSQFGVVRQIK